MPTISMFYGILLRMFFRDIEKHHVPHIHAEYQGEIAVYAIHDGTLLAGNISHPTSTSLSWRGLKSIKKIYWQIGN
jgi:hypothetical protein